MKAGFHRYYDEMGKRCAVAFISIDLELFGYSRLCSLAGGPTLLESSWKETHEDKYTISFLFHMWQIFTLWLSDRETATIYSVFDKLDNAISWIWFCFLFFYFQPVHQLDPWYKTNRPRKDQRTNNQDSLQDLRMLPLYWEIFLTNKKIDILNAVSSFVNTKFDTFQKNWRNAAKNYWRCWGKFIEFRLVQIQEKAFRTPV